MQSSSPVAIGIDLGTTYSCVGVWRNNRVEIVPNEHGNRTTPSYVSFTENERFIGETAKSLSSSNPKQTIFDAKRLIGRKFNEPLVQADSKLWPFKLVAGEQNQPLIEVQHRGETKRFTAEEISACVLMKMKSIAENYLGEQVKNAVITVPAYFSDAQRQATKDAGAIAGLNVMRIINEPTAAAIAYGLGIGKRAAGTSTNILIFDLGGGTFDVSLLTVCDGVFEVKATAGDTHLGGEDFDQRLMNHFMKEIELKHQINVSDSEKAMRRLRTACERAKCALSSVDATAIELENLFPNVDFRSSITRDQFESLCADAFQATLTPVEQVLRDAGMDRNEIDEIVLVGGSTRIPKIQSLISQFFGGKQLNKDINPDEAVAFGATVQSAILNNQVSDSTKDILLIDVTPLSLGIETAGGLMQKLIPRNSTIPGKQKQIFSTFQDNQQSVLIQVYEGERVRTIDNNLLGTFELTNLPAMPRGVPVIEVTFELDSNGILSVTAVEKSTGVSNKIVINHDKGRLSSNEIKAMIVEAENYRQLDEKIEMLVESRSGLESYAVQLRNSLNQDSAAQKISSEERETMERCIRDICEFIDQNCNESDYRVFDAKYREMEETCQTIVTKLYEGNVPILC